MLRPGQAIYQAMKRSFDFKTRSRRSEFWWFNAFIILGVACFAMVEGYIFPPDPNIDYLGNPNVHGIQAWLNNWKYYGLSTGFTYFTLPAFTTVAIRRLHDIGRRGWPVIVMVITSEVANLVPISGSNFFDTDTSISTNPFSMWNVFSLEFLGLAMIYMAIALYLILSALRDSHAGDNRYGPSPKYNSGVSVFD